MKKTAIRFGLYGIYAILALFLFDWLLFSNDATPDYGKQEIVGWIGILLSVIFVYFGLKYYRDKVNGGRLSFGEGLKLGLLIILLPSIAFGLFNVIYILYIDPEFLDKYYAYQVQQATAGTSAADLPEALKDLEKDKEMFQSPFIQFIIMFFSVFMIGLIVTVISTLILRRREPRTLATVKA